MTQKDKEFYVLFNTVSPELKIMPKMDVEQMNVSQQILAFPLTVDSK